MEKKLATYQETVPDLDIELPCNIVPSVTDVVVKFVLEKRKSDHYNKLLHSHEPSDSSSSDDETSNSNGGSEKKNPLQEEIQQMESILMNPLFL